MTNRIDTDGTGTFLGFGPLQLVGIVAAAVFAAVIAFPYMGTTCGTVVENGTRMAAACMSEHDMRTVMDRIESERGGRAWTEMAACDVAEHGPTGPEASVTVGRTVIECDDGTTRINEWNMSDGSIFAIHVRDASGTWTVSEDGR